jgi:hypothetical protein
LFLNLNSTPHTADHILPDAEMSGPVEAGVTAMTLKEQHTVEIVLEYLQQRHWQRSLSQLSQDSGVVCKSPLSAPGLLGLPQMVMLERCVAEGQWAVVLACLEVMQPQVTNYFHQACLSLSLCLNRLCCCIR